MKNNCRNGKQKLWTPGVIKNYLTLKMIDDPKNGGLISYLRSATVDKWLMNGFANIIRT